jgi:hypothetical protein
MISQKKQIMKRTILTNTLLCLSLLGFFMITSCEKDNSNLGGGSFDLVKLKSIKKDKPDPDKGLSCNNYGTFTSVMCGASIFDNYWIQLDDGTFLQPCATDLANFDKRQIKEGTRVRVGFEKLIGKTDCDDLIICQAIDERTLGSIKVGITCLEIVKQEPDSIACNFKGIVVVHKSCKEKTILGDNGIMIEPINQRLLERYNSGDKVMFAYSEVSTFVETCTGAIGVEIHCISPQK